MKKFTKKLIMLISVTMICIGSLSAQDVIVEPGFNTLYDAVVDNPGATLVLQRGGQYVIDKAVEINVPTIIKGETTPDATAPAVVSFYGDPGTAGDKFLFAIGANCTLKDFGMSGYTADLQQINGLFAITAAGIDITIDGIIGQSARYINGGAAANDGSLTVKNSKFFNFVNEGWDNWGGFGFMSGGTDATFKSVNNTFFMCGRIMDNIGMTSGSLSYNEHNSYVNIWGETYYPETVEGFVAKNNLYYNTGMRGYVGPRTSPEEWAGDFNGDYPEDSVQGDICIYPTQAEKDGGGKDRNVNVSYNVHFTTANILAKQAEATATMMPLVNKTMRTWFEMYDHWIFMENKTMESGNSVDPQFEQAIPEAAYEFVYKQMIERRRTSLQGVGFPYPIGYWPNGASKADFIWPLPFNLKPTNPALSFAGDDGYPVGDINWYGAEVREAFDAGLDNPMANDQDVTVEPGFNTLYDAAVDNPGATLILLRGGEYVIDKAIEINVPTIIKGEAAPEATPPAVVSFYGDPGTAGDKFLFAIGANCTLKDFGMVGYTADLQQINGLFAITASGIDITIDGIVGQSARYINGGAAANDGNLTVKNSKFYNFVNEGWDNWGGFGFMSGGTNSTFKSMNNTFFMCGRIMDNIGMTSGSLSHNEHNSYINIWGETYYPETVDGFVAKNNLYYNTGMRGYVGPRTSPEEWAGDFNGDYPEDSIQGDICIYPTQAEKDGGGKDRNVNVSYNVHHTTANILAKQAEATATMMPLVNKTMRTWFDMYDHWIFKENKTMESGNSVDPQFKVAIPEEAYEFVYKQMIERRRTSLQGVGFPYPIGWWPNGASKADFIWPLPFDFTPTNPALSFAGDDGYPIGDINWYGTVVRKAFEDGLENPMTGLSKPQADRFNVTTYPNPVRSNSKISYTLSTNSKVKLSVYNTVGAEVTTLVNATQAAGQHEVNFDASRLPGGMYFCKIQVGNKTVIQKISVVK